VAEAGSKLSDERIDELFALKASGLSGREIARRMQLSPATCSAYLSGKRGKTGTEILASEPSTGLDDYRAFVERKLALVPPTGIAGAEVTYPGLFDHQRALATFHLRRGRSACFADTGLGKSRILAAYARGVVEHTGKPFLILTPLAVAPQMKLECEALGVPATVVRSSEDVRPGVNVCNYQRLHLLDPSVFGGVGLDESSCVKDFNSKTLAQLKDAFDRTPFRLSATATPSPNDLVELGTQAELLGICSRTEMLAEYFVHDGGDTQTWRLKGHARREFWRFVASWSALVRSPADLGFDASAYVLPPVDVNLHVIDADADHLRESGKLFADPARGLMEQRQARRVSMDARVARCVDRVRSEPDEPFVVWCELNDEQDALAEAFGDKCASVYGALDIDEKEQRIGQFVSRERPIFLSKPSVAGWGLNLQFCARMQFVGISNSWEAIYQAKRRIWRFGQKRRCIVDMYASAFEGNVARNLQRKEDEAQRMAEELSRETAETVREAVIGQTRRTNVYEAPRIVAPQWLKGTGT
jgi:hypothetical protein